MDSGSTVLLILLIVSVLGFLWLHGAEAALPLLRRSQVRESLPERGFREAAVRRLRVDRAAYEDLIRILGFLSFAGASALLVGLFVRADVAGFSWVFAPLAVVGLWLVVLLLRPLAEAVVTRFSTQRLSRLAVFVQLSLWPLLPVRVLSLPGLRLHRQAAEDGTVVPAGVPERVPDQVTVEEEIAEEPLDPRERLMIRGILDLEETPVREIMVPRVDVVSLDADTPVDRAIATLLDSGHSRLPVYESSQDNIIGVLYSRDLLAASTRQGAVPPHLRDLLRPGLFVPESKRVDEMLSEFQERRVQIAVVVDEYGGVAGIVTIEDLLEEIVGEIEDEFDVEEPTIVRAASGPATVDARIGVDAFNEAFNAVINPEGFDTLGGFLYRELGKIPSSGDLVRIDGLEIEVASTVGRRIKKVRVRQVATPEATEGEAGSSQTASSQS